MCIRDSALKESVVADLKLDAEIFPFPATPWATAFTDSSISTAPITLLFSFAQLGPLSAISDPISLNQLDHSSGTDLGSFSHLLSKSFMKTELELERNVWSKLLSEIELTY